MDPHAGKIVINGAPSQYDRWLPALGADYAQVDGRSFQELLDFAVRYGRLINFYSLSDEIDGDWVPFFLTDPTMLLAAAETADPRAIEDDFARRSRATAEARDFNLKFELLRRVFELILGLARQLNLYAERPEQGKAADQLTHLLDDLIARDLGAQLRTLRAYDEGAGLPGALGRPIGLNYSGFAPVWDLGTVCPDGSIYRGRTGDAKIDHALPHLEPIFRAFLYATSDLEQLARANFDATLEEDDHKPQIALYLAFARLFRAAQDTVNTVQRRYLDFYYRDILRESRRGPLADSVYLTFTLAEDDETLSTTVPRGTLFPAGQDEDDRDILYAANEDLAVSAAAVAQLQTLRVVSGSLYSTDPPDPARDEDAPPEVVRRVLASTINTDVGVGEAQGGWATFGETHAGASEVEVTEPATLGFAVASNYLLLTGGSRTVTLEVAYPAAFKQDVLDPSLAQLSAATGLSADEIFQRILEGAFILYVSTATGWFRVEGYGAATATNGETEAPSFGLWFELPSSVPAVVAYDPANEGAGAEEEAALVTDDPRVNASDPAPSLPTLKVYLRQEPVKLSGDLGVVYTYPLSLLAEMSVTSVRLRAEVFDLTDLRLTNTDGEVDASALFLPFGALPVVGSFLLVQHRELFVKLLTTFQLALQWFNLPANEDGFKGYYKYYVIGPDGRREPDLYNNRVFLGRLGVEHPGYWSLGEADTLPPPSNVYLFRTRENCDDPTPTEAGALCADSVFTPEVYAPLLPSYSDPYASTGKLPAYYNPDESAVKLELTAPSYAFGNGIYAQNVLNAVIEDLPEPPATCEEKCAAECQPLADAAACIEACLECLKLSPPDIKGCIKDCLECLLFLAVPCIERCLNAGGARPGGEVPPYVRERVRMVMALPASERERLIRQRVEECRALLEEDSRVLKCLRLFEAALCVVGCAWKSSIDELEECLSGCHQLLLEAYNECKELCVAECESLKKELRYPNEPYLPQATKLSVNYTAECTIITADGTDGCGQFFHLLPFGGYRHAVGGASEPPTLLPRFTCPGNLYLGFTGLLPPQTLTLLFQMMGEAEGAAGEQLPPVVWEYLSDNRWTSLRPAQVRSDRTNGLQQTGVVKLALPTFDPSNNTVFSSEFQWLRAAVASEPGRFPRCAAVYPHALLATWQNFDNTGEHLARPLPPRTITTSVEDLPDIETIDQPIESFGGRPPENARDFDVRVGERLRHKDRAVLGWDYERLVLERYPVVWKVQALPARNSRHGDAPGEVLVVVVSGPDSLQVVDPTTPILTGAMLEHIGTYLAQRASPFVRVHVVNPLYVRIEVTVTVVFGAEEAQGAAAVRLNDELVQYLSPWFYDAERAAKGGRYASEDDISEFIQTRPYVEAMSDIKFRYDPPPTGLDWYFLTSARKHYIQEAGATGGTGGRVGY
ncbi:MAG TPA: hypothetical protein VF297_17360 [Pyrinomonadaceae bacterium]